MVTFAAATKPISTIPTRAPAQRRLDHFVAITCSDPNDSCDLNSDDCRSHAQLVSPSRDPIGFMESFQFYGYVTAAPLVLQDPTGMLTDAPNCQGGAQIPKARISHKVNVTGPTLLAVDFAGTTQEVINYGGKGMLLGAPGQVGDTIAKVNINATFTIGSMLCKTSCCDGEAFYLDTIAVTVDIDITVKYFNWTNPPQAQKRNWQRLKDSILLHEDQHVKDAKKLAAQLEASKPQMGPIYALICVPATDVELRKQIATKMNVLAMDATKSYQQSVADAWNTRWDKAMRDFHKSPAGHPIQIEDFIR